MIWKPKQIEQALSVKLNITENFGKVHFNSKDVNKGDIFIALDIGNRDGHEFVIDAINRGAALAIVNKDIEGVVKSRLVKVTDTFQALSLLAGYKRINSKATFIGITGTVGKTSTKEALGIMLSAYGKVFVGRGNFNNYIGLPINLASMPDDIDYAVIEMGMSAIGELRALTKLVTPDIAIITSISEGHLAFFKSVNEINDAKCEIFQGLKINSGVAIINFDIETYQRCLDNIDIMGIHNIQTFGKKQGADIRFISYEVINNDMVHLKYLIINEKIEIIMPLIPEHLASNFAACFAAIKVLGLDIGSATEIITTLKPRDGRGTIVSVTKNNKQHTLICDYYNSNPESLRAALRYLRQFDYNKKIAILGDMRELGVNEGNIHKSILPYIVESGVSRVLLVGSLINILKSELPPEIEAICYDNVDELIQNIDKVLYSQELILIKGSRGVSLEKVAQYLGVENAL